MIKRHERKNSGYMRRSSRIYLNDLNKNKTEKLYLFLLLYANVVRYFIERFWSEGDYSNKLPVKAVTDKAVSKFGITARLAQLAGKQAKEIVVSQSEKSKSKRKMPSFRNITVNVDQRFFMLTLFNGSFDWALKFGSGVPKIVVPFNNTKHTNKFLNNGWRIGNTVRMGIRKKRLFIDLIFEKPKPEVKKDGEVLGLDTGYRVLLATSNGQILGKELKDRIKKSGKRRKSFHYFIGTEIDRIIKQLDLSNIKMLVIENLKNVKHGKRGKFSRKTNRFLSFWQYARVINRLKCLCEENGIKLELKNPAYTSQRCPCCDKIDKKNRNRDEFRCINCGFEEHADIVGAMNLKELGLAGVYSLGLLKNHDGIYVH